ncbi:MAG: CAP domain-containing protein [Isosphaeraceae bacterium]|nr:CAP domain-containing protein [Isosphaeraceae bacterium]
MNHPNPFKTSTLAVMALLAVIVLSVPGSARAQQAAAPAAAAATTTTTAAAAPAPASDPYGFTNWLNATRASYGLAPVGYDPNLASWAHVNNTHQNARGMGHHVMGPARRQNSAMGSYGSVPGMWMSSPAHRAALLDPSIRWIGIAGLGAYWTYNAY